MLHLGLMSEWASHFEKQQHCGFSRCSKVAQQSKKYYCPDGDKSQTKHLKLYVACEKREMGFQTLPIPKLKWWKAKEKTSVQCPQFERGKQHKQNCKS